MHTGARAREWACDIARSVERCALASFDCGPLPAQPPKVTRSSPATSDRLRVLQCFRALLQLSLPLALSNEPRDHRPDNLKVLRLPTRSELPHVIENFSGGGARNFVQKRLHPVLDLPIESVSQCLITARS